MRPLTIQSFLILLPMPTVMAFHYRFYFGNSEGCSHDQTGKGAPPFNEGPLDGKVDGSCRNSPWGTNWDHLEIDYLIGGGTLNGESADHIITYCDQDCKGGVTGKQSLTHCFVAPKGCAIGSFRAITGPNKV